MQVHPEGACPLQEGEIRYTIEFEGDHTVVVLLSFRRPRRHPQSGFRRLVKGELVGFYEGPFAALLNDHKHLSQQVCSEWPFGCIRIIKSFM